MGLTRSQRELRRITGLAPDLTPAESKKLKAALRQADQAKLDAIREGKNQNEAFVIWRKIANGGLPDRKKK